MQRALPAPDDRKARNRQDLDHPRIHSSATPKCRQGMPSQLHHELAGTGVQVQACCPGLIDTDFHAVAGMDLAGIPFPVLRPDEVAGAALAGLRLGEVVCVPGLSDPSMIDTVQRSAAGAAHDRGEFGAGRPLYAGSRGVTGN